MSGRKEGICSEQGFTELSVTTFISGPVAQSVAKPNLQCERTRLYWPFQFTLLDQMLSNTARAKNIKRPSPLCTPVLPNTADPQPAAPCRVSGIANIELEAHQERTEWGQSPEYQPLNDLYKPQPPAESPQSPKSTHPRLFREIQELVWARYPHQLIQINVIAQEAWI